jgi:flagellar hook-basal body complex protein FliE
MNIDAIQGTGLPQAAEVGAKEPVEGAEFDSLISSSLGKVNDTLQTADASLQAYAAGQDIPIHDVMINMEQARITLQLAVQVRNSAVEAYQEFMRMQI